MPDDHKDELKFTFTICYQLLKISSKTFLGWLKKAKIDPEQQRDRFDPRKKYLYKSQLVQLAEAHARQLPANLDNYADETENAPATTLEELAEQLTTLRTEVAQRFDQVDHAVLQLSPLLESIATNLHEIQKAGVDSPVWQQLAQRFDQIEQVLREQTLPPQVITSHPNTTMPEQAAQKAEPPQQSAEVTTPVTTATKSPTKKTTTAGKSKARSKKKPVRKKLPRNLVALRDFAKQHNIAMERASAAGKSGKIALVRGEWLVNSRIATEALAEQGRHDFYQVFHDRQGFTPCSQCPHSLPQQAQAS